MSSTRELIEVLTEVSPPLNDIATQPSLDRNWELPLPSALMESDLFNFCNTEDPNDAATLASASHQFAQIKKFNHALDLEVKALLREAVKWHSNVAILKKKNEPAPFFRSPVTMHITGGPEPDCSILSIDKGYMVNNISHAFPHIMKANTPIEEILANLHVILEHVEVVMDIPLPLKARKMAEHNHALILTKTTFTEECDSDTEAKVNAVKRKWTTPISPLQYAAWSGNIYLVNTFFTLLPDDLKPHALKQLRDVRDKGLEHPFPPTMRMKNLITLIMTAELFGNTHLKGEPRDPVEAFLLETARGDYNVAALTDNIRHEPDTLYLKKVKKIYGGVCHDYVCYDYMHQGKLTSEECAGYQRDDLTSLSLPLIPYFKKFKNIQIPLKVIHKAKLNEQLILTKRSLTKSHGDAIEMKDDLSVRSISALQYAAWKENISLVNQFLEILSPQLKPTALIQLKEVLENSRKYSIKMDELAGIIKKLESNLEQADQACAEQKRTSCCRFRR